MDRLYKTLKEAEVGIYSYAETGYANPSAGLPW